MRIVLFAVVLGSLSWIAAPTAHAGSETPPKGPPWKRAIAEAQAEALRRDLPIFLYFTKTF